MAVGRPAGMQCVDGPTADLPEPTTHARDSFLPCAWLCSPQKYYELYMQACDELRNLEASVATAA